MQIIEGKTANWEVVIGLEVHAQIASKTKLFSRGSCDFGGQPNSSVNIFDAAMPGTLPVLNFSCVEQAVKTGLAVGGKINLHSVFERKHYFYPDLPHGYQITQNSNPIITGGKVVIKDADGGEKVIRIHHIHMEQDAGKSMHDLSDDETYIDLNRAGVPLMEIVSQPDIKSSAQACAFINKLKLILQYTGSSGANMEKGELRCDANVSVRKVGDNNFGTRCEIKNLNSTKSLALAIDYEAKRQVELIESGGQVEMETKLFDSSLIKTRAMREKEDSTDYRYFPEPDLLPLVLKQEYIDQIATNLAELPDQKEQRYIAMGLNQYDADVIVNNTEAAKYFDSVVEKNHDPKFVARWLTVELFGNLNKNSIKLEDCTVKADSFSELISLIEKEIISERIAKEVLAKMLSTGNSAKQIVQDENLAQILDINLLKEHVISALESNENELLEYLNGKEKLFGFFVGQVMKKTGGKANPQMVNEILQQEIKKRADKK